MLIALVDDTANDRRCLEHILREYDAIHRIGMGFCHYDSGEAFLREFQPFRFAVVFMDVYMSGMSGVETSEKLREKTPTRSSSS